MPALIIERSLSWINSTVGEGRLCVVDGPELRVSDVLLAQPSLR